MGEEIVVDVVLFYSLIGFLLQLMSGFSNSCSSEVELNATRCVAANFRSRDDSRNPALPHQTRQEILLEALGL